MSAEPPAATSEAARHFLTTFASALHAHASAPSPHPPSTSPSHSSRRKPRRRLRPVSLTSPPANDLRQSAGVIVSKVKPDHAARLDGLQARVSPPAALDARAVRGESPFLRALQTKSVEAARGACSPVAAVKQPDAEPQEGNCTLLSDDLRQQAAVHAAHIRAISNQCDLFLEALLSLHQLAYACFPNAVQQSASSPIHHASSATRVAYCQAVLKELRQVLRTFPIPIQRALKQSAHEGHFPQHGKRSWVPPHPPNVSFRLLQEECSDVKPMSNRLKTNLEVAWDVLLDMLRSFCGRKKEAAGSFSEEKLRSLMSSLHPCNIDIFAARFVNLLSTHTINAQQPTHIRLLDERLHALSTSSNAANHTGVVLHRVPQCILVAFDDVPAHKFFARFLTSVDSSRLNTALLPRFLARVLTALNRVSAVASNHEFCDAVLEARLYARFLTVVMHAMNWSHSPFAISGSSLPAESLPPQKEESGKEKVTDSETSQSGKTEPTNIAEQSSQTGQNEKEGTSDERSSSRRKHQHAPQSVRLDETPGLGSHALKWRAWHLSAFWQSVSNINELVTSAVSSKQTTAVIAAAAVADVFLRFAAVDPVAKSSTWFQDGLSAIKKLHLIDQSGELHMPLIRFLKADLLTCAQIDAKDADLRADQTLDDKYVLRCNAEEWAAIGNMRLLQECCTSLARFRKNLAELSETKPLKTPSRRITPRMTGATDSPSPLHGRSVPETYSVSKRGDGQEHGNDQDTQERFRKEFLSRLDSRLLELMQVVMSSRPESEEDARKKYSRVAKTLYSDVPITVRAVAAHICGHQVGLRLQSEPNEASASEKR